MSQLPGHGRKDEKARRHCGLCVLYRQAPDQPRCSVLETCWWIITKPWLGEHHAVGQTQPVDLALCYAGIVELGLAEFTVP